MIPGHLFRIYLCIFCRSEEIVFVLTFPEASYQPTAACESAPSKPVSQPLAANASDCTLPSPPPEVMAASVHPAVTSPLKRGLDILGAIVGLILTSLVALPVAVAIQLDNPGPVFYSQVRCGYRGRSFRIWKFRSMVSNADGLKHLVENQAQGLIFKNENDPRITRVGRFLRRTSLDELPQFWNVLKGDMSLVGTRPPTLDEVSRYEPHHWQRLNIKPGMTGEWQVKGRSNVKDFEAIVEMDLQYQQQWSVVYDLQLILQTINVVLRGRGAC